MRISRSSLSSQLPGRNCGRWNTVPTPRSQKRSFWAILRRDWHIGRACACRAVWVSIGGGACRRSSCSDTPRLLSSFRPIAPAPCFHPFRSLSSELPPPLDAILSTALTTCCFSPRRLSWRPGSPTSVQGPQRIRAQRLLRFNTCICISPQIAALCGG